MLFYYRERSYSVHEGQNKERLYSAAVHEGRRDSFEIINQQRHDSLEDDDHTHHTHLCFCCDDVPFLADDLQRKRKKRTVKIGKYINLPLGFFVNIQWSLLWYVGLYVYINM